MELQNKVAIVTGASKGIGLETVKILLEAGAKVAGWSRSKPELEHENFLFVEANMRQYASVEKAFRQTTEKWGNKVAILVNNAGLGYQGSFETMPMEEWHAMFETNVNGIFYATRLALPMMKELGEAHIINISSIAGTTGIETMAGYCGSKHAVRGISHALYKEVRNHGIKVSCIYPGSVKTHFFDKIDSVQTNDNMMRAEDIAKTILYAVQTHPNFHLVDIEMRPLKPKG